MKKTREQKGITLVALIITIVVLLVLATVAISSIQNDGIISKAQDVANKFNEAQTNEQGILDEYLSYLEGNSGVPEELEKYILGPNKTGRLVTEVLDTSTGMPKDEASTIPNASTAITIISMSENDDSTKGLLYMEYKDKIYEVVADLSTYYTESVKYVRDIGPELIFEGKLAVPSTSTEAVHLVSLLDPMRKYDIKVIENGETVTYSSITASLGGPVIVLMNGSGGVYFAPNFGIVGEFECEITAIYDVGPTDTYVEENEFAAYGIGDENWTLCSSPDGEYIVPETVKGKLINIVDVESIKGIPIFTRPVVLNAGLDGMPAFDAVKVTTSELLDSVFNIFNLGAWFSYLEYMDFSECGDDIEFPEEFLSYGQSSWDDGYDNNYAVVYVSSAVKANYVDYDFIQVKQ